MLMILEVSSIIFKFSSLSYLNYPPDHMTSYLSSDISEIGIE